MKRRIPAQRVAQFESIAAAARRAGVVLAVGDEVVAGQYSKGGDSAGGDVASLHFRILGDAACDASPKTIVATCKVEPKGKP